jgi:hypothetical protein
LPLELCCFHLNETRGPFESAGLFGTNKIVARITNDVTCRMHESVAITAAPDDLDAAGTRNLGKIEKAIASTVKNAPISAVILYTARPDR